MPRQRPKPQVDKLVHEHMSMDRIHDSRRFFSGDRITLVARERSEFVYPKLVENRKEKLKGHRLVGSMFNHRTSKTSHFHVSERYPKP